MPLNLVVLYHIISVALLLSNQEGHFAIASIALIQLLRTSITLFFNTIVLFRYNLTQLFSISTRIRERLGDIIVKDIKRMLLLRPRLLESLKLVIENYLQDRKAYLNITTALSIYILIIRTKGIRSNVVCLIISF